MKDLKVACLVLALLAIPVSAPAQTHRKTVPLKTEGAEGIEGPIEFNPVIIQPFPNIAGTLPISATGTLKTSWIPGENAKGMMRYKLRVEKVVVKGYEDGGVALNETSYVSGERVSFLKRLQQIDSFIILYDKDEFIVRRIPVYFTALVDDNNTAIALEANSFVTLSRDEYRTVARWNFGWANP